MNIICIPFISIKIRRYMCPKMKKEKHQNLVNEDTLINL